MGESMNIVKTNIPENLETVEKEKIILANKVLSGLIPLMNETYQTKLKNIKNIKDSVDKKKKQISFEKAKLENLMQTYESKKKVKVLLERIMKLMGSGLLIGEFKKEMLVVLNVIEELPDDKLNYYLNETIRVFNKKNA
jgi:hypothetical protein